MTRLSTIERRIARILAERMALNVGSPEIDLVEHGYLDSVALVTMLQHLEEAFDVRFGPDDLEIERFRSISRIARFIEERVDRNESAPPESAQRERQHGHDSSTP